VALDHELEELERRPLRYFFTEDRQTCGWCNGMLLVGAGLLIVEGLFVWLHVIPVVLGGLMLVQLTRNYRRYEERVFFARAARDRPHADEM
jgi:hypothetical protein